MFFVIIARKLDLYSLNGTVSMLTAVCVTLALCNVRSARIVDQVSVG